jgi:hypothetical protein
VVYSAIWMKTNFSKRNLATVCQFEKRCTQQLEVLAFHSSL